MANILTSIRVICGLLILIFPAFSGLYYALYLAGGVSDAIDGSVARRLGRETSFGAKYDTAADFVFVVAVIVKIVNAVRFPAWLLVWICVIFAVKVANPLVGFVRHRQFITVHSVINKVCGAVCFVLPLLIGSACAWQIKAIAVIFVCVLSSAAAVHESIKIWNGRELV